MKKKAASHQNRKWITVGATGLVVVFAVCATYLALRPRSKTVAQVNGVTITQADINRQTAFPLARTPGIFDTSGGVANQKNINEHNLNAAIDQELLLQEAKKRGIIVSSRIVNLTYDGLTKSYLSASEQKDKLKQAGMTEAKLKTAVTNIIERVMLDHIRKMF